MHLSTKARQPVYYLFSSRQKAWVLTAFSIINLLVAIKSLVFPSSGLQVPNATLRIYVLVMESLSAVVLSYWIAKSSDKLERVFIALWLVGWAMLWFAPVYSNAELLSVRYANVLVWVVATTIALRILKAANAVR